MSCQKLRFRPAAQTGVGTQLALWAVGLLADLPSHSLWEPGNLRQGKAFATWMERCEALLEEQDEANYLAKKQCLIC